jgi:anti-anti-sigma factor
MGLVLDLESDRDRRVDVLSVRGEVDIATVAELEEKIESVDPSRGLVVDLTSTDFMDSSGLRLLVASHERFSADGRQFRLAVSPGPISRLLDVTGLLAHLQVHETVEEATSV